MNIEDLKCNGGLR